MNGVGIEFWIHYIEGFEVAKLGTFDKFYALFSFIALRRPRNLVSFDSCNFGVDTIDCECVLEIQKVNLALSVINTINH